MITGVTGDKNTEIEQLELMDDSLTQLLNLLFAATVTTFTNAADTTFTAAADTTFTAADTNTY